MDYLLHICVLICVYSTLAITLDLQAGYAGKFSLAHAALWGIGAYTYGVLALNFNLSWLLCVFVSLSVGAIIGALFALPAIRLAPDQFVIATFAAQAIFVDIAKNYISLTGGPSGLSGIPSFKFGGLTPTTLPGFALVAVTMVAVTLIICIRIVRSPTGRILKGIREDPTFVSHAGKNTSNVTAATFAVSGGLCACTGAVYASYMTFIDPSTFSFSESVFVLTIVIVGGAGTLVGPHIAAALMIIFQESLRFIGLSSALIANIRGITYGLALVLIVLLRPQGILGQKDDQLSGIESK